jgi:hypothetical protein
MALGKLYGWSFPVHVAFLSVFALLFIGFIVLAVMSAPVISFTRFQWVVVGVLTLSSGISAAWELRVVLLMRKAREDASQSR